MSWIIELINRLRCWCSQPANVFIFTCERILIRWNSLDYLFESYVKYDKLRIHRLLLNLVGYLILFNHFSLQPSTSMLINELVSYLVSLIALCEYYPSLWIEKLINISLLSLLFHLFRHSRLSTNFIRSCGSFIPFQLTFASDV